MTTKSVLMEQQEILFPKRKADLAFKQIAHSGVIVCVGANGSGKSRLGEWLDSEYPDKLLQKRVYRISAQKSLRFPKALTTTSMVEAAEAVLYGRSLSDYQRENEEYLLRARHQRFQVDSSVPLDDYEKVVRFLYSEHVSVLTEKEERFERLQKSGQQPLLHESSETDLKRLMRIWETILPHRKLRVHNGEVEAFVTNGLKYNASELSDGERAIFYLIGQCLIAPKKAVLVIDEPELHLHKAIQSRLWDAIEGERPDCTFLYLTHDVQFAATRRYAPKVWLKGFDGNFWDYEVLNEDVDLPEDLYLTLLGSRTPVLFTESTSGKNDERLYRSIFNGFTVVPLGGCGNVIRSVAAFKRLNHIHRLKCYGIIDRDHRSDAEVQKLKAKSVHVLKVSELENLFLIEDVLQEIESLEKLSKQESRVANVKQQVFDRLKREKAKLAAKIASARLKRAVEGSIKIRASLDTLKHDADTLLKALDVAAQYQQALLEVENILISEDYNAALKVFDDKDLVYIIARTYGRDEKGVKEWLFRQVESSVDNALKEALKRNLPQVT